ncbi:MAG: hypothetical protein O3A91_00805 [Proteobacteria bacterium]|nr:hypothetical protein [Pseudomonadota bacterium]
MNRSMASKRTRLATPAARAFSAAATRDLSSSMPRPRAPRRAASMTMRPSPDPRSMTVSPGPTSASCSMRETTSIGVTTKGTLPSSQV